MQTFASIAVAYLLAAVVLWSAFGLLNLLFFELVRPGDNDGPRVFANAVYKRIASAGGEWSLSDRPPLQAAFELFFTPLRGLFGSEDTHQAVGTLLQVSCLAALLP